MRLPDAPTSDSAFFRAELPRSAEAPGLARGLLDEHLASRLSEQALADAHIVVSELVTNAFRHGEGRIELRAAVGEGALRVEVVDDGSGYVPEIRASAGDETGGFGLRLVDRLSRNWGAFEGTTHVWADLPL